MMSTKPQAANNKSSEQGFMLLGLIVAIAIILLGLSVAATKIAFSLRRERELESARRANQFVRAVQLYYKKLGHYPPSLEALENTNNVRYLRQRYVDPLTGKDEWRLIAPGQNKTTVKGFFGEPLDGIGGTGLGAASGMQSPGTGGTFGSSSTTGTSSTGASSGVTATSGSSGFGSSSTSGDSSTGFGNASGLGSASGMASKGLSNSSSGPLMGVGSKATGKSIIVVNEQTTYETWEFLYDPRIEKLKLAAAMNGNAGLGGGTTSKSLDSFGQNSSSTTTTNSTPSQTP
jgi:type II secretory pathway pseudopilin PulG